MMLFTKPNLQSADNAYASLIAAHKGLSEEDSIALNARLILILMNHIGDQDVLNEALSLASGAFASDALAPESGPSIQAAVKL